MRGFFALIDRLEQQPAQAARLEMLLWETFGVQRVVLALDMSGFSRTVREQGIVAFLCHIRRMQRQAVPALRQAGGELVKCDADNLMVVFEHADAALQGALAARAACAAAGIAVSIGLDRGRILLIPETDCYGDAVNIAYKLGEDLAGAGEILLSDAVRQALTDPDTQIMTGRSEQVSGLQLQVWSLTLP